MSGSETGDHTAVGPTPRTDEQLSRLFAELQGRRTAEEGEGDDRRPEALLETVLELVGADESFAFDERLVTQSLDELLLMLISMRTGDTNGNALMRDFTELFDSQLSPGTVYPALHALEDEGTLEMFELVRSKEYRIADRERAATRAEAAARQHLVLGAFLYAAATDL
jgi:hypothetical protein